MIEHRIFLIGGEDDEQATFTEEESSGSCRLTCEYRGKKICAEQADYFEAFCIIRLELEKEGLIPFCYGASLNVYPSRMSREMASGKAAYKMQVGKHVTKQDLVRIFEEGTDVIPASVAQQKEFYEEWLASEKI